MTAAFPDPQEEFWAQDPTILTPPEAYQAQAVENNHGAIKAAVGIGAAYLVYRQYMKRRLSQEVRRVGGDINPNVLHFAAAAAWRIFTPRWVSMTAPYLIGGYIEGIEDAQVGDVPAEYLQKIAEGYAEELGNHINTVSSDALLSGYQAQVNRRVPPFMAAKRTADAYGVPKRGMNALVNVWTAEEKAVLSDQILPSHKEDRAQAIIESQNALRARQIGENEAWAARTQGKQLVWMYGQSKGVIPATARRVWITAADEKVCSICGPMDGKEAAIGHKFTTPDKNEYWTPPSHVNCRCDVVLDLGITEEIEGEIAALLAEESVRKDMGRDHFDRDRRGRFSRQEERTPKPYKDREAEVDALLAQVNQALSTPVQSTQSLSPPTLGTPALGSTKSLSTKGLSTPALNSTESKPGLSSRVSSRVGGGVGNKAIDINLRSALFERGPIREGNIETFEGTWFELDKPLVYLNKYGGSSPVDYDEQHMILIEPDEELYEMDPNDSMPDRYERVLAQRLRDHWNAVEKQMTDDWWDKSNEERTWWDEDTGVGYVIEEDDYVDVLLSVINHADQGDSRNTVRLYGFGENHDNYVDVPMGKLASYTNIYEDIAGEVPHLIVIKHGFPGVTTRINGEIYSNPGKFLLVGDASNEKSLTHYDYQIHYAEPMDLLDEDLNDDDFYTQEV